jgi:integrase
MTTRSRTLVETGIYREQGPRGTRYVVDYTDGAGRRRSATRPTLEAARLVRAEATVDRARGTAVDLDGARMTLRDYFRLYAAARSWRPSTVAGREDTLARLGPLLDRPLATIRATDVRAVSARMLSEGYAVSTTAATHHLLSSLLAGATADRYIAHNPAASVPAPRVVRSAHDAAAALDAGQVAALLEVLPDDLAPLARLILGTGLRPSEAVGVTVDRVDFLRRRITIDRQLDRFLVGGVPTFGPPKTPSSVRVVAVPASVIEDLSRLAAAPGQAGLLFTTRTGRPWTQSSRSDAWRAAVRRLGDLPDPVTLPPAVRGWHALRHTYATTALLAGVPLVDVSRALGHRSIAETQQTYAHALTTADVDAHADHVAAALGL